MILHNQTIDFHLKAKTFRFQNCGTHSSLVDCHHSYNH